ncbi:DUF3892 domain-containing protein [Curtobacterium flaccumfaciens pv. flaccumfaciens]|uniref:DUF3892 domain-containing protein n=1 Tax=Curtobacterium TaxID=2034 RepID=UPI000DA703BE|nr:MULTISPECIES: DUF3892 domain-containing protein [Curtobacterium]MBO9046047.1 DUF3892 domain-containing protein [Curtobacterium flaccumfaciens pv. flaccumfaciens]MCS5495393.1 DUF3892 domain-containing protein [Curtobacterium flaccumfaciens pv. flaccumfaciens]PZF44599.1 DUF3892 domain-containing protein [Curtobacterium sp. MCLR17_053]PZF52680.1 DUF3892 domain-containing protein [Curtobacterium sp. MCLR17_051]QTR90798.1 DUF3892 domain-containing protein [Curtobacterium flaccumfaciens pv. flacc
MSIRITHIRLANGVRDHEHISHVRWVAIGTGEVGSGTTSSVVVWIDDSNGRAYVGSGAEQTQVGTVHPTGKPAYLRTYADGAWSNNLLSLPTF